MVEFIMFVLLILCFFTSYKLGSNDAKRDFSDLTKQAYKEGKEQMRLKIEILNYGKDITFGD